MAKYDINAVNWRIKGGTGTGHTTVDETGHVQVSQDETGAYCVLVAEIDHRIAEATISNPNIPLEILTSQIRGDRGTSITIETNKPIRYWDTNSAYTRVVYNPDDPLHPHVDIGMDESQPQISIIGRIGTETVERAVICNNPVFSVVPRQHQMVDGDTYHFAVNIPGLTDVVWTLMGASSSDTDLTDGTLYIGRDEVDGNDPPEGKILTIRAYSPSLGAIATAEVTVTWAPHLMPASATIRPDESIQFATNWDVTWTITPYDATVVRFEHTLRQADIAFDPALVYDTGYRLCAEGGGHSITALIRVRSTLEVTPATADIVNGQTQIYTAPTSQHAAWHVEGHVSNDTYIDRSGPNTGILHMGWDEPAGSEIAVIAEDIDTGLTGTAAARTIHKLAVSPAVVDASIGSTYDIHVNEPADGLVWGVDGSVVYGDGVPASEFVGDAIDEPLGCMRTVSISAGEFTPDLVAHVSNQDGGEAAQAAIHVADHRIPIIRPIGGSVAQGATRQYTADVPVDLWMISDPDHRITSLDTVIDSRTGLLTVGWDESAPTITITAVTPSKYGQPVPAVVMVEHIPMLRPATAAIGSIGGRVAIQSNDRSTASWSLGPDIRETGTWTDPETGKVYRKFEGDYDLVIGLRADSAPPANHTCSIILIDANAEQEVEVILDEGDRSAVCILRIPPRLTVAKDTTTPYVGETVSLRCRNPLAGADVTPDRWDLAGQQDLQNTVMYPDGRLHIGELEPTAGAGNTLTITGRKSGYLDGSIMIRPLPQFAIAPSSAWAAVGDNILLYLNMSLAGADYEITYEGAGSGVSHHVISDTQIAVHIAEKPPSDTFKVIVTFYPEFGGYTAAAWIHVMDGPSLTVYPRDPMVPAGARVQYHAATSDEQPVDVDEWSIAGATASATQIDADGTLSISPYEPAGREITIRAAKSGYLDGTIKIQVAHATITDPAYPVAVRGEECRIIVNECVGIDDIRISGAATDVPWYVVTSASSSVICLTVPEAETSASLKITLTLPDGLEPYTIDVAVIDPQVVV